MWLHLQAQQGGVMCSCKSSDSYVNLTAFQVRVGRAYI